MRMERIAHDESQGSHPNPNVTAFRQNSRQHDLSRLRHVVTAVGHFRELLRQIFGEHMDSDPARVHVIPFRRQCCYVTTIVPIS